MHPDKWHVFWVLPDCHDCLLAVRFPMAASRKCTPGRAKRVITIDTFMLVGANLNIIFTMKIVKDPTTGEYNASKIIFQDFCCVRVLAGPFSSTNVCLWHAKATKPLITLWDFCTVDFNGILVWQYLSAISFGPFKIISNIKSYFSQVLKMSYITLKMIQLG
jgi:hypothetical protein